MTTALLIAPGIAQAADAPSTPKTVVLEPAAKPSTPQKAPARPAVRTTASRPALSAAVRIDDVRAASTCEKDTKAVWSLVRGPGDVQAAGWAHCSKGEWTFTAEAGSGHVGGMTLKSDDFSGTLTIDRRGTSKGAVTVSLPWTRSMLPDGKVAATLSLTGSGSRLDGTIVARDSATGSALSMRGPVAADGTFTLPVSGYVSMAGKRVPMSGSYRSGRNAVRGVGSAASWLVRGAGHGVHIDGATFSGPQLTISSTLPAMEGSSVARIDQNGITAPVRMTFPHAGTWIAHFDGSSSADVKDPRFADLTLLVSGIGGTITDSGRSTNWHVTLPMLLNEAPFTLSGSARLVGPRSMQLSVSGGTGDLYGNGQSVTFTNSVGTTTVTGNRAHGVLGVGAPGEFLAHMPEGWTSSTELRLTPKRVGSRFVFSRSMRFVMVSGPSRIVMTGAAADDGKMNLTASGSMRIGETDVPVTGGFTASAPGAPGHFSVSADTRKAPDGHAILGPGIWLNDTVVGMDSSTTSGTSIRAVSPRSSDMPNVTYTTSGSNVTINVTTSSGDTIQLAGTIANTTGGYIVTVAGVGDDDWEPFEGLSIPVDTIGGTITVNTAGAITAMSLTTGEVTWVIAEGVTIKSALTISTDCPLTDHCPESEDSGDIFYVGGSSAILNIPSSMGVTIPQINAAGAFTSDGSWVRWDASTGSAITITGPADSTISMSSASVTIFSGQRDDTITNLGMPDLGGIGGLNDVNVQACGTFKVTILDLNTGNQQGCAGVTKYGVVLGQVNTGGAVSPTDDHNGLTLSSSKPPTLSGFAWSSIDPSAAGLSAAPIMDLYGQAISLVPDKNSFTASVTIPGSLMSSLGTGINTDTTYTAVGWFTTDGQFEVDLSIPVNLKASGMSLDTIDIGISRVSANGGTSYDFTLDGSGALLVSGHHYPLDAQIALKTGTQDEASVSLTVIGDQQALNVGTFDDTSLIAAGDFEPPTTSMVDGNFDDSLPPNDFTDGGFEAGLPPHNLVTDASFEDSASSNLLSKDAATFDGGTSGNILDNPSFDDTDAVANGDFEGLNGDTGAINSANVPGWLAMGSDTALSLIGNDAGPSGQGSQVVLITNNASSVTDKTGLYQWIPLEVGNTQSYVLSGWARPDSGSNVSITAMMDSSAGLKKTTTNLPANTWTPFSVRLDMASGGYDTHVAAYLQASGKARIAVDDVSFGVVSANPTESSVPGVGRPTVVMDFENQWNKPYTASSGATIASSTGTYSQASGNNFLQTDGCYEWWAFDNNSQGYANGDFDYSNTVYFPGDSNREIANVGFFMQNINTSSWQGYFFRLQTSNGDGGFFKISGNNYSRLSGAGNATNAVRKHTYRVHLYGTMPKVTAVVSDVADGSILWRETVTLPDSPAHSGVFGQYWDSVCTSAGSQWDDVEVFYPSSNSAKERVVFGPDAHSAPGYVSLSSTDDQLSYMTRANTSPTAGQTYVYSTWVKSGTSSNVEGNLRIYAVGGGAAAETASTSFTATSSWQLVRVTLPVTASHTDLRVGFTEVGSGAAPTIYVDDQSLQQIPWGASPTSGGGKPSLDVISMANTKENLAQNPSMENPISGWISTNGGRIANSTSQAKFGSKSVELSRTSGSTADDYVDYAVAGIAPSTTYTVSGYLWLPTGATPDKTYGSREPLWAVDPTNSAQPAKASVDFGATGAWQRVSTTITTSPTASSLTVRLYTPTGGGWFIDGLMVEEGAALDDYFAGSVQLSTSDNVLRFEPVDSTSKIAYSTSAPNSGTVYSMTARVRSIDDTGGFNTTLAITDGNGTSTSTRNYAVTTQWTSIGPLTVTSAGGSSPLKLAFQTPSNGRGIYIDDVQLVATEATSSQSGALGKLPAPAAWPKGYSSSADGILVNSVSNAHTGQAYLRIPANSMLKHNMPGSLSQGQQVTATVWVKAPSGVAANSTSVNVSSLNSAGTVLDNATATFSPPQGQYMQATVTLPVATSGAASVNVSVQNYDTSKWIAIDDVSVQLNGQSMADSWGTTGQTALVATDDSTRAHSGDQYLQITTRGAGSGTFAQTATPTTTSRTYTAWVRATSGSVAGSIGLAASNGQSGSATASFTATTTWQQVAVTLGGLTANTRGTFTSSISLNAAGTLVVDDVATRDLAPFTVYNGASAYVVTDPSHAASSPNYLSVTTSGSGKGVKAPSTVASGSPALTGGSSFTVTAHVKTGGAASLGGTIGLDFGSQSGGSPVAFTADDTWQQVTATFTAPSGSFTSFTPKFELSAAGTLLIDNVTVQAVQIAIPDWHVYAPSGTTLTAGAFNDPNNAHDGSMGHLQMSRSGSSLAGVYQRPAIAPKVGETYSSSVWVRSRDGQPATVRLEFWAEGGRQQEMTSSDVTVGADWQLIQTRLQVAYGDHPNLKSQVDLLTSGVTVDVDDFFLSRNTWVSNDTGWKMNSVTNPSFETDTSGWTNAGGGGIARSTEIAYTGKAAAELTRTDGSATEDYVTTTAGGVYSGWAYTISAYVWLPQGASASALYPGASLLRVDDVAGGRSVTVQPDYTKTGVWQRISTTITASSQTTSFNVRLYTPTGGNWFVDGLLVQMGSSLGPYFASSVPQDAIATVGAGDAYEGTGFARISNNGPAMDSVESVSTAVQQNSSGAQTLTAWVRNPGTTDVSGTVALSNGCTASQAFTAHPDTGWSKVQLSCTLPSAGAKPTVTVSVNGSGNVLDLDAVTFGAQQDDPITSDNIEGITTALDHPETGYRYLWDDAFGVKGLHLWGVTGQIQVIDGYPGLGLQATVYQDPTAFPKLLFGTAWIKGDAVVNISEVQPCFGFDFHGSNGTSGISIASGALKATDFSINIAPTGCAVGSYVVPQGESLAFDAIIGDANVHFDLDITTNDEGQTEYAGDASVSHLNLGGINFREMTISIAVSSTTSSATFVADLGLPFGDFTGNFTMSGGGNAGTHIHGDADMLDWAWASSNSKGLQISELSFGLDMDVDSSNCAKFSSSSSGSGTFGNKSNLAFDFDLAVNCGVLTTMVLAFDYTHGGTTQQMSLSYDDASHELAGGIHFKFQHKLSWKLLGFRYHRTSRIDVGFAFSMDTTSPSSAVATLDADIKVSGGGGSGTCTITGQPSDSCALSAYVDTALGGKSFSFSW